jgi:hypothetical protein
MLDRLLLRMLVETLQSLGGGPVEQGRIGSALRAQKAARTYLRVQHGSLINFLLLYGGAHFVVQPGINGNYWVRLLPGAVASVRRLQ